MKLWLERFLIAVILLAAAFFRLTAVDWDGYFHYHPDERYITWIATTVEWPPHLRQALVPDRSPFNPYHWPPDAVSEGIEVEQGQPRKFAYGHLPLYMGVGMTRLMEWLEPLTAVFPPNWLLTQDLLNGAGRVEFHHLTAVSRALTGLIDLGTVWLIYLLGRRLYNPQTGLLAAAFLAVNVMHIQLAHFFTADPYMTFFVVASLFFMVRTGKKAQGDTGRKKNWWSDLGVSPITNLILASVCIGLGVGSKFGAVLLFLPLMVTVWLNWSEKRGFWLGTAVLTACLAFFITNPFAVLDFSCEAITPAVHLGPVQIPRLDWRSCYLQNIGIQNRMVHGTTDLPFTRQYEGTLPYLYFIEMQLRWGMGPLLAILAFAGLGWSLRQAIGGLRLKDRRLGIMRADAESFTLVSSLIILTWVIPYFLMTGALYVKFMRYLQPITPFLMLFGAVWVMSRRKTGWRWGVTAVTLATTTIYAISFVNLYRQPHPWLEASRWVFANVEPGTLILSEQWDDSLPSSMWIDDTYRRRGEYSNAELTWHSGTGEDDNVDKLAANLELLAGADYMTIVSNRIYGVVPRLPDRYPLSSQFHQQLFDGSLGYKAVAVFGRSPNLSGFQVRADTFRWPGLEPPSPVTQYLTENPGINWGRADESFLVYDQPLVMIFQNMEGKTVAEMSALFD